MKNPAWFIKVLFVLTLIFFLAQGLYIHFTYKSQLNIIRLELADGVVRKHDALSIVADGQGRDELDSLCMDQHDCRFLFYHRLCRNDPDHFQTISGKKKKTKRRINCFDGICILRLSQAYWMLWRISYCFGILVIIIPANILFLRDISVIPSGC